MIHMRRTNAGDGESETAITDTVAQRSPNQIPCPPVATEHDLLTTNEVAAIYGVDPKTIRRWVKEQRLTAIKPGGGPLRFRRSDLVAPRKDRATCPESPTATATAHHGV
jgi:excisionase family DNA binding protein